jgi:hypothetical protein
LTFDKTSTNIINVMNNTAHFGFTATGNIVALGVGADTKEVANLLADNYESVVSVETGKIVEVVALVNISDLYRLRTEITDALNGLDNEALGEPVQTFGL